jgi:hypothetical protein
MTSAPLPEPIRVLCEAFRTRLVALLGDKLFGRYLHGASVFPGFGGHIP